MLDGVVDLLARGLDALGLNGTRLRWRWNQRRRALEDAGARSELLLRSARGKHKMCPACRALVPRAATSCPECQASMSDVRAPGAGRLLANAFPGIGAAASLVLLVNGFWFVIMLTAQIKAGSAGSGALLASFDPELLVRFGAGLSRERLLSTGDLTGGEWWRIVTPIFLHGGLLHFLFNSYVLIQLGPIVEQLYGAHRFWVVYLCCGLAGSATSQLPRFVITVGASGAIMGLIGLLAVHAWRHGGVLARSMRDSLVRFGVYMLVLSLFFNIDHLNHAGGFACGALAGLALPAPGAAGRAEAAWQIVSLAGVLLVLLAFLQVALFAHSN